MSIVDFGVIFFEHHTLCDGSVFTDVCQIPKNQVSGENVTFSKEVLWFFHVFISGSPR